MKNKNLLLMVIPFLGMILSMILLSGFGQEAVSGLFTKSQLVQKMFGHKYHDIYKEEDRSQLIKFSHKFHLSEAGAECLQCHAGIEKSEKSSDNNLAKMEQCYTCHDQKTTDCKQCHLEKSEPYSAFKNPKRELVFSHKLHLSAQGIKCETCHKDAAQKDYVNVSIVPKMESCMGCHDGAKASNDCRTCHTDIRFLKPADHNVDFIRTHKQEVAAKGSANCEMCHAEETCSECHESGNLSKFKSKDDMRSSMAPSGTGGSSTMILEKSHALDYLFTHRFDAKAKTMECQSCHETESFCSKCHNESGKVTKPAWHSVAGFVGPGGGMHAKLAEKDMENCASCHQEENENPVCLRCHTFKQK
jgi:c(7)-type cytochrome triheme protein